MKEIVLIPDKYFGNASGAVVAQVITKLLVEIGCNVHVFSDDIAEEKCESEHVKLYPRIKFAATSLYFDSKYKVQFNDLIDKVKPECVFTVGSITNKPLCYLEVTKQRHIRLVSMIFMQDFYCVNVYPVLHDKPCRECLDSGFKQSFKEKCIINSPKDYLVNFARVKIREKLKKLIPLCDCVIGSSDEQLEFYKRFGVPEDRLCKIPLFFDDSKLKSLKPEIGDYYIGIAQNRIEKGFQLIPKILDHAGDSVKVVLAYNGEEKANEAIKYYGLEPYIKRGILKIEPNLTWSNGLGDKLAKARGVIIPTIWPTTTEFGLLEALGLGKTVFAFDIGIHHEVIRNGENGYAFPLGDFKAFGETLKKAAKNKFMVETIGKKAIEIFNNLTNLDCVSNKIIKVLNMSEQRHKTEIN
ncbi:MAG: hypothetical protein LKF31_11225 [Muribaculaceae bacterium]|jgi:glycosyltransferase involved in cell wall biosynthesis|nr:hypothetical protein [Muribaculaceae bacterium]